MLMVVVKQDKHITDIQLTPTYIQFLVRHHYTSDLPLVLVAVEHVMLPQLHILLQTLQGDTLVEQEDLILHLINRDILVVMVELVQTILEPNQEVAAVVPVEVDKDNNVTLQELVDHLPLDMIPVIGTKTQVETVVVDDQVLNSLDLVWH